MDLYFAGSGSKEGQEEIKRLECNQLLSYGVNRADAYKWIEFKRANPEYKGKLFIDSGAHSISTGVLKNFKLLNVAGAYWRGDAKNDVMTRIYGTCWFTKEELDEYLVILEERKARDHRKLGRN